MDSEKRILKDGCPFCGCLGATFTFYTGTCCVAYITCDSCGRDLNTLSECEIEGCEKPATMEYWNSLDDEETTKVCKEHGREAENNSLEVWELT